MSNFVKPNRDLPPIGRSNELLDRAKSLIPCATQTLAKGPTQHVKGAMPVFSKRGKGARLWDVDGNEFLDYQMGIGPLVLGYSYPAVDEAISAQLSDGITFSLPHELEVEVAELVRDCVPNTEAVRYSKTGCDVTTAAIRLARAFTGRENVLCCGYHGWHDWYISVTSRNAGIPEAVRGLTHTFDYNRADQLAESINERTAAVILEPMVFEEPREGFLQRVRELCDRHGALLIFDEMWTGFRFALGGAQEKFGVRADLATFSKAIANGMPLSVITGRADVMRLLEDQVFFFTTFGGEALSLAAAKATMQELRAKQVPQFLGNLGRRLKDGVRNLVETHDANFVRIVGADCRTMITFDPAAGDALELKSLMQQELARFGILWSGFHNLSFSHTQNDVDYTLSAYNKVLPFLRDCVRGGNLRSHIKGEVVGPVFRRTANFNMKPTEK
jgi:glutamate-1-semialdehyde 2,1-aminomutase